ncbi:hypothetical protein B0I33_105424 [Prauserella shujinwangii]|uniref:Uncharacterized protein n=1 Tax=Prauserella shujinwangii TaxID=1453103 RepID=A0A2T0LVG1_9PSEU|nr:hypothetical protein B0I33_105424 [Prauserella shujinwangii]
MWLQIAFVAVVALVFVVRVTRSLTRARRGLR